MEGLQTSEMTWQLMTVKATLKTFSFKKSSSMFCVLKYLEIMALKLFYEFNFTALNQYHFLPRTT